MNVASICKIGLCSTRYHRHEWKACGESHSYFGKITWALKSSNTVQTRDQGSIWNKQRIDYMGQTMKPRGERKGAREWGNARVASKMEGMHHRLNLVSREISAEGDLHIILLDVSSRPENRTV